MKNLLLFLPCVGHAVLAVSLFPVFCAAQTLEVQSSDLDEPNTAEQNPTAASQSHDAPHQDHHPPAPDHAGMQRMKNMANISGMDKMVNMSAAGMFLMGQSSGTAMNPMSWPMPAIMTHFGAWNAMFMSQAYIVDTQQSGPRGHDKFYSTNWFMTGLEHKVGRSGSFMTQIMLSLEPATVTDRRYPLLFQTGETAFDKKIVDAQHPHDFIMSLGFEYAHTLGEDTTLELYFAPVGDPAIGPIAYPHRASAMEMPEATLGHHWQDSTHIANEVVTAGIKYKMMKLEASGFYGAEPNENRWNIDSGPIDSWSTRLWFFPSRNWAAQVSVGRLHNPERFEIGDQVRSTASLHYTRPMRGTSWSSSLIWGRNHSIAEKLNTNSYVFESVFPITRKDFATGRIELIDKNELFRYDPDLEERLTRTYGPAFRVGAYTVGYTHDINWFRYAQSGLGGNFSIYTLPDAIRPYYGDSPFGLNIYLRLRLRSPG